MIGGLLLGFGLFLHLPIFRRTPLMITVCSYCLCSDGNDLTVPLPGMVR